MEGAAMSSYCKHEALLTEPCDDCGVIPVRASTLPSVVSEDETAAFHRGVDAAKDAIRSEADADTPDGRYFADMFVNAIARHCGFDRGVVSEGDVWDECIRLVMDTVEGYKKEFKPDGSSFSVMKREVCFAILRDLQSAKAKSLPHKGNDLRYSCLKHEGTVVQFQDEDCPLCNAEIAIDILDDPHKVAVSDIPRLAKECAEKYFEKGQRSVDDAIKRTGSDGFGGALQIYQNRSVDTLTSIIESVLTNGAKAVK
jgi:hypothetical protein